MQLTLLETKKCRCCEVEKELPAFPPRATAKDGYRNVCRQCRGAQMKEYQVANASRLKEQRRARYIANRDQVIVERATYRTTNADRINARRRELRHQDPDRFRALARRHYAHNAEAIKNRVKARAFRRRTVNVEALLTRDQGYCGICGVLVDLDDFHIDHIVPRVAGGSNDLENLQLAHPFCNQSKNKTVY